MGKKSNLLKKKPNKFLLAIMGLILFFILCTISTKIPNSRNFLPYNVFFSFFSIVGLFYNAALFFCFCFVVLCNEIIKPLNKTIKNEEKLFFICFTVFFIIGIIYLIFIFHAGIFGNTRNIINNIKKLEPYNSFIMDDNLSIAIIIDLICALFIWAFYFWFCIKEFFKLLRTFPILFVEKFLRSVVVAVVAWLVIATNIGPMTIDGSVFFKFFYIIFGSVTVLAYPLFDMFENTYQQIDEYGNWQNVIENRKQIF